MFPRVLVYAAFPVLFASSVLAQGVTVCVFQGKESHDVAAKYASDTQNVAAALSGKALSGGSTIQAIAVPGVDPKQEDAAAQDHQCSYIVSVWREEILAAPAGFAANMQGNGNNMQGDQGMNQSAMSQQSNSRLNYSLRRIGSRKKLASGEVDSGSPWDHVANDVMKKLARDKK